MAISENSAVTRFYAINAGRHVISAISSSVHAGEARGQRRKEDKEKERAALSGKSRSLEQPSI